MAEGNFILDLTFKFSLASIAFSELLEEKKKFNMARQFWRSSTSIGALVRESQGAESKIDFCHKMKIAYKEAEETEYWLMLCKYSASYPFNEELLEQISIIKKVLGKIITSSKKMIAPVQIRTFTHLHTCTFTHSHTCTFTHLHI